MSEKYPGLTLDNLWGVLPPGEELDLCELRARLVALRLGGLLTGEAIRLSEEWNFPLRELVWSQVSEGRLEFTPCRKVRRKAGAP